VLTYLLETNQASLFCSAVDEAWVAKFRKWLIARPIVSPTGKRRERSLSTAENSVLQLAAAITRCGGEKAKFRAKQPKVVNRTPQYRATVDDLTAMFRYCLEPSASSEREVDRRRRERRPLLTFLRISVATLARPDAAFDVSTTSDRRQWNSQIGVLNLNPDRRKQTRKYRAIVPICARMRQLLDAAPQGPLIPVASVKSAWNSMATTLSLPGKGESGMKLIRRSVANIVRSRLPQQAWGELEMFLGHDRFDPVSDLSRDRVGGSRCLQQRRRLRPRNAIMSTTRPDWQLRADLAPHRTVTATEWEKTTMKLKKTPPSHCLGGVL
jgi:hypothetical protein